ncbi:MAG: hypothetical protein GVY36_05535 [Verrucomicrobia bacterium]|jgi:hypothetical protein|nr:hypothetical protein [Verrucomicrobiota bacterium]
MLHNKEVEKKIAVVDALVKELENHRDQAKAFQAAADALKAINQQIVLIDNQFADLNSEALETRMKVLEKGLADVGRKLSEGSVDVTGKLDEVSYKIKAVETNVAGTAEQSVSELQKLSAHIREETQTIGQQIEASRKLFQDHQKKTVTRLDTIEAKVASIGDQSATDAQKLSSEVTRIEELANNTVSRMTELRTATREAIEQTRDETHSFIKDNQSASCELITAGKGETIEMLKNENAEIKELIAAQSQKSQKWAVVLLIVGLCASGLAGAILYFILQSLQ